MATLNFSRAEVGALVRELKHAPKTEPIESVRRKLDKFQLPTPPLAGQMDVYDCLEGE